MSKRPSFLRHSAWVNQNSLKNRTINIVGCGAVGSNAALMAAKMGFTSFQIWDDDLVEDHNLPNQAYFPSDINTPKVVALQKLLESFNNDIKVIAHNERFTTEKHKALVHDILLIATDSMSSRADLFQTFNMNRDISMVIDTRLGFDYAELYCVNPSKPLDALKWQQSLRDDSEIPDGPCNLRLCTSLVSIVVGTAVQYMCVPYATWKKGGERTPPSLTRFSLSDCLRVGTCYNQ